MTAWPLDQFHQQREGPRADRGWVTAIPMRQPETPRLLGSSDLWSLCAASQAQTGGLPAGRFCLLLPAPSAIHSSSCWENLAVSRSPEWLPLCFLPVLPSRQEEPGPTQKRRHLWAAAVKLARGTRSGQQRQPTTA